MTVQESLIQIFMYLLRLIFLIFNPFIFIPAIIVIILLVKKNKEYKNGAYYQITKLPYFSLKHDIGKYGEYLTYKYLKNFETTGSKFLFNVYLPKENSETSEIDVLMISPKGIFVFESKNYSGWIFGSETQKNWYQTLPKGRGSSHKEHFYNPIMQNRSHIKHLKAFLGEHIPMRSIIVFSDRCTLKSIQIQSKDISVINRYNIEPVVSSIYNQIFSTLLTERDITEIYNKLYPYTQVNENIKTQHITNIHNNSFDKTVQKVDISSVEILPHSRQEMVAEQKDTAITYTKTLDKSNEIKIIEPILTNSVKQDVLKCPKCNSNLVLRTATRGANIGKQFYGCSNYPKCRYIKNI